MELKDFQKRTLDQVKQYLTLLSDWRSKSLTNPDLEIDFPAKAWEKSHNIYHYQSRKDGLNRPLPNFCLKIPTGGGKTILAVKTIDLINAVYLKKQSGLVLWVVPTTQIYRQTIKNLRNREHPYRQHLDMASAGRTQIREKGDKFTPQDVRENLVILMLMLPSASRQNKDTLRMFKDSGGFQDFFPPEDNLESNQNLLNKIPNLDTFEKQSAFWGRQIKTSLGNTLRLLSPVVILDEGHKAYSETAQHTLRGFNPSIIVELSATPTPDSNILVDIRGQQLNQEEMIKLDLHIINKASTDYKDTLLSAANKRNALEEKSNEYYANTHIPIRPICLIQVERTGKEQRTGRFIHSEDVREHLVKMGISPEQIAVKTSEKDELKDVDDVGGLMSSDCPIRYIITKQALQEGWDCAFAYVLAILTNPSSKTAMTQLVGRILRQPYARKTKIRELDESYVFCFQQRSDKLLHDIRSGFSNEGLGDLASRAILDEDAEGGLFDNQQKTTEISDKFKNVAKHAILPVFVTKDKRQWRPVSYEVDIISGVPWNQADLTPLFKLPLSLIDEKDIEHIAGLSEDQHEVIHHKTSRVLREAGLRVDLAFMARHLIDVVPNPWIAYEFARTILAALRKNNDEKLIAHNFVFIIEETKKHLFAERDRLAHHIFAKALEQDAIRFWVIGDEIGFKFPQKQKVNASAKTLTKNDGRPLEKSLFDFVPEEDFNDELEKPVAWFLEDQSKLLFWYRNRSRTDYSIQGWRKNKIYPDFIASVDQNDKPVDFDRIFVIETKGEHLVGSDDSEYKKRVFSLCNKLARPESWSVLGLELPEKRVSFHMIEQTQWRQMLTDLFILEK
jgi:type III restriction enzyme